MHKKRFDHTNFGLSDTIAAISTAPGESGIGIVRISGKEALSIADKIFVSKDGKPPSVFKSYTLHYGWIVNGSRQQGITPPKDAIDEALISVMLSPKSYTKEDVVEINCHGGIVALRAVLDLVLEKGCRLAEPGEFTKRAFLNGRIDLSQAEAVLDVIRAKTDSALKVGLAQLRGVLSSQLNRKRKVLFDCLSVLEAGIDFPEEEAGAGNLKKIRSKIENINSGLKDILESSACGRIFREGVNAVICGKPNVGKSSLLNALLKEERSIVTPVAGTTRDTIEEVIDIRGIPVCIVDTAGILEPRDMVEKKAVQRTHRYIDAADLIILLFDASRDFSPEDGFLVKKLRNKNVLAVINKIDLKQKLGTEKILKNFKNVIRISAKRLKNVDALEQAIADVVYNGGLNASDSVLVSNMRHIQAIKKSQKSVAEALNSLDNKLSFEFISQNIKDALLNIDGILGKDFSEELLDRIFSDFCIGK